MSKRIEVLRCVGGPFDGQMMVSSKGMLMMQKDSLADIKSGASLVRSVYERDPAYGDPAVWRIKSVTPMRLM